MLLGHCLWAKSPNVLQLSVNSQSGLVIMKFDTPVSKYIYCMYLNLTQVLLYKKSYTTIVFVSRKDLIEWGKLGMFSIVAWVSITLCEGSSQVKMRMIINTCFWQHIHYCSCCCLKKALQMKYKWWNYCNSSNKKDMPNSSRACLIF